MNLYEIKFRHYAPKDSREGTITYLLAESDEEVYEWICSEPEGIYVSWMCYDNSDDDEYEEGFKERIVECNGDMYDDESEVYDLYYGATQYGWNCICENVSENDIEALGRLGFSVVNFCRE